jgi:hypothetical protein
VQRGTVERYVKDTSCSVQRNCGEVREGYILFCAERNCGEVREGYILFCAEELWRGT